MRGEALEVLSGLEGGTAGLCFTSPPYFNARKYAQWETYEGYLADMKGIFAEVLRVLLPGRFLAVLSSPVITPRARRQDTSTRWPVPFDLAAMLREMGFAFYDDIVWRKPEGAGVGKRGEAYWRARRTLTYRATPIVEYLHVFRSPDSRSIDHWVRSGNDFHPSGVPDPPRSNVWDDIAPVRHALHPAVFPLPLAERVVALYSQKGDLVLDPFGGIGTAALAAKRLGRRFLTIDRDPAYAAAAALSLQDELPLE